MESVARKIEIRAVFQQFGEVIRVDDASFMIRTPLADVTAKRAASCLLDPAVGDRVLLVTEEGGDAYVLAVLGRVDGAVRNDSTISVEGDLVLRSLRGRVSIAAQEGIDMVSATAVRILAKAVDVDALEALSVLGGTVKAELGKVKMYASTLDSFFERVRLHAKHSHRTIEELDQVNARHIDYAAGETAHLRGQNTLVTAHELVKVNGEQVHVG